MKTFLCFLFAVGFFGMSSAQNDDDSEVEIISHRVLLGQTVRLISVKYFVTPADIYRLNKFAIDGISEGMVLQIPLSKSKKDSKNPSAHKKKQDSHDKKYSDEVEPDDSSTSLYSKHIVSKGETLSGISRKYGILLSELKRLNNQIHQGNLLAGETLLIPAKD